MQVDDGAKAAPETILNAGEDWLTIIEGSLHVIPQDHWGIGASIKVRLDGDRLVISADEPGYSESISLRIPALTTRPEPAADAVEAMTKTLRDAQDEYWREKPDLNLIDWQEAKEIEAGLFPALAKAALQADAGPEEGSA